MISEKESLEKDNAALKKNISENLSNIKQQESTISNLKKQLQLVQDRMSIADKTITTLTDDGRIKLTQLQEKSSIITEKNKVIEMLQRQSIEASAEIAALITAKDEQILDLQSRLQKMETSATKTGKDIVQYKKDIEKLKRDLSDRDKTIAENTHLLTKSRIVEVQILFKQPGEIIERLAKELTEFLKTKCNEYELRVIRCMKGSDIQPDVPLLLVFVSTHGYGQDVLTALKRSIVSKKTALVIARLKLPHALPVHPSDRILTSKEIECLGGMYDIAFTQDKGIYACTKNDENVVSILNFIARVVDGKMHSA